VREYRRGGGLLVLLVGDSRSGGRRVLVLLVGDRLVLVLLVGDSRSGGVFLVADGWRASELLTFRRY
jgi:hypothetical protein